MKFDEKKFQLEMDLIEEAMIHNHQNDSDISLWGQIIWAAWRMGEGQWSSELKGLFLELLEGNGRVIIRDDIPEFKEKIELPWEKILRETKDGGWEE